MRPRAMEGTSDMASGVFGGRNASLLMKAVPIEGSLKAFPCPNGVNADLPITPRTSSGPHALFSELRSLLARLGNGQWRFWSWNDPADESSESDADQTDWMRLEMEGERRILDKLSAVRMEFWSIIMPALGPEIRKKPRCSCLYMRYARNRAGR